MMLVRGQSYGWQAILLFSMPPRLLLELLFGATIFTFLVVDLTVLNRRPHAISLRSASWQTAFWVALAMIFAALIFAFYSVDRGIEFLTAYATEEMLSVDNLFVMLLLFNFFNVEEKYQHRVLFYGILGALVLRGLFIGLGTIVVDLFHWVLYIFGAVLVYTGIKLFFEKKEEHVDFRHNRMYRLAHRLFRFTQNHHGGNFFVRENGKLFATTLFLVLILIEWTDLVFAVDSIPAAFSITQDQFIIYTSNIFAILGLRSLYFLLEAVIHKFHHLQKGLSIILIAIGAKMLLGIVGLELPSILSFAVVIVCLAGSVGLSLLYPKEF